MPANRRDTGTLPEQELHATLGVEAAIDDRVFQLDSVDDITTCLVENNEHTIEAYRGLVSDEELMALASEERLAMAAVAHEMVKRRKAALRAEPVSQDIKATKGSADTTWCVATVTDIKTGQPLPSRSAAFSGGKMILGAMH